MKVGDVEAAPDLPLTVTEALAFLGAGAPAWAGALLAMAITSLSMASLACIHDAASSPSCIANQFLSRVLQCTCETAMGGPRT